MCYRQIESLSIFSTKNLDLSLSFSTLSLSLENEGFSFVVFAGNIKKKCNFVLRNHDGEKVRTSFREALIKKKTTMADFQIFKHDLFGAIRTMTNEKGESFFVGKDVAESLGYSDPQKALKMHVDEDDKLPRQIVVSGQRRKVIFINESGLYSLILSSKLPTVLPVNETTPDRIVGTPSRKRHQQTIGVKNDVHYCL